MTELVPRGITRFSAGSEILSSRFNSLPRLSLIFCDLVLSGAALRNNGILRLLGKSQTAPVRWQSPQTGRCLSHLDFLRLHSWHARADLAAGISDISNRT